MNQNRGKDILLTKERIEACRTPKGGFTAATLLAFGVKDTKKPWRWWLTGTWISQADYEKAMTARLTPKERGEPGQEMLLL